MKNHIFIVTHKSARFPNNQLYTPIVVGKNRFQYTSEIYFDNTSCNISEKNENYCELTALYWIWKNIDDFDFTGLCHYRRFLMKKLSKSFDNLLSLEIIKKDLNHYDMILPKKRHFYSKTVYQQYFSQDNAFEKDYLLLRKVLLDLYPEYLEAFDNVSRSHSTYLYNILICKKTVLNHYCEWLFDILFEIEQRIDMTHYTTQQKRIFGFLSERLLTVYVEHNRLSVKEYEVVNIENSIFDERKGAIKNSLKKSINKLRGG